MTTALPYFILQCLSRKGSPLALFSYPDDPDSPSWMSGKQFGSPTPPPREPITVGIEQPGTLPEFTDDGVSLMTPRLRTALENAGVANIDYYAAEVTDDDGRKHPYFAFNIIGKISATDKAQSKIDKSIPWIHKLVLDEAAIRQFPLFRLAESPGVILIRSDVRTRLEEAGIDTLTFLRPDQWVG